ncbi:RNase adapter RapZ [Pseudooceanicola sp.]|uniref:RNase adapter RapZ n=1 Tax=Pseudooceanicola sp. TaxID=1914328 RepID=UPI002636C60A|nr:RNase adapter RapZ [Pseudooceanicola sp.]MDF1855227.1 RNase adapter RapZ [Pseudooceanicola sp.]
MSNTPEFAPTSRLVFVTGPSGAGRSTAIHVLEDLGYEAIDNMPLSLIPRLMDGPQPNRPMALGIDVRNRDFSVIGLIDTIDGLSVGRDDPVEVLYLDARTDVLIRRYSETRRRHPLAETESLDIGVERELDLLTTVRARADFLIDTSDLTPHDLRDEMERWFTTTLDRSLAISVHSFSYKRGVPRGIDMMFDTRFLRNPHWDAALRDNDGRDQAVQDFVAADPRYTAFFSKLLDLCDMLLPAYVAEGKAHLAIAFGCTGGQHRSVTLTERLANALAQRGWQVSIRHRELERRQTSPND